MTTKNAQGSSTQIRIAWRCTCFNVRRASRTVTQFYDDIMETSGIKATQFTMLGAIAMMGPASVTKLSDHLILDRTTLTRNLKVLEKLNLINISTGEDRRERVVRLTEHGKAALARATPVWQEAQQLLISGFGEERWRRMIEDMSELGTLIENFSQTSS